MSFKFASRGPRHVAIVGSRHHTNYSEFCRHVRPLIRLGDIIVSGGAAGIDTLAARFARQNRHQLIEYLPDDAIIAKAEQEGLDRRAAYARAAYARNQQIVDRADIMLAIRCPHSRGTLDSIARFKAKLRAAGIDPDNHSMIYLYNWNWSCTKGDGK